MTATLTPVPSKGTPRRTIRVPDDVWDPAIEKAHSEGTDVSTVIRDRLTEYIEENQEQAT